MFDDLPFHRPAVEAVVQANGQHVHDQRRGGDDEQPGGEPRGERTRRAHGVASFASIQPMPRTVTIGSGQPAADRARRRRDMPASSAFGPTSSSKP